MPPLNLLNRLMCSKYDERSIYAFFAQLSFVRLNNTGRSFIALLEPRSLQCAEGAAARVGQDQGGGRTP